MGCCLSSSTSSNSSSPPHHSKPHGIGNRAPPPLEEESVKEVLSETPKPNCSLNLNGRIPIHPTREISDETLSTTTLTEKMDDYQDIRHSICRSPPKLSNNRSLSHDLIPRRDRSVGKSPSRKSDHSPGRINGGTVKLVQSRAMGQGLVRPEPRLQNRTESSYRRSRSPATTRTHGAVSRTAAGRSPSVRRSGMSPGRDHYRKEAAQTAENETIEGKWRTTNESIDNPLVSLECFIFL